MSVCDAIYSKKDRCQPIEYRKSKKQKSYTRIEDDVLYEIANITTKVLAYITLRARKSGSDIVIIHNDEFMKVTDASKRSITNVIGELTDRGIISVVQDTVRRGIGSQSTTRRTITLIRSPKNIAINTKTTKQKGE